MQHREPRRKVLIQARVRAGASWNNACILDMSSRGMLVRAESPPPRGSYLEICRGSYVIIARVVWSDTSRFGVQTQDLVPSGDLVNNPDRLTNPARLNDMRFIERPVGPYQPAANHEVSRWRARVFEFATFAFLGVAMATLLLDTIGELFTRPLATVEAALSR